MMKSANTSAQSHALKVYLNKNNIEYFLCFLCLICLLSLMLVPAKAKAASNDYTSVLAGTIAGVAVAAILYDDNRTSYRHHSKQIHHVRHNPRRHHYHQGYRKPCYDNHDRWHNKHRGPWKHKLEKRARYLDKREEWLDHREYHLNHGHHHSKEYLYQRKHKKHHSHGAYPDKYRNAKHHHTTRQQRHDRQGRSYRSHQEHSNHTHINRREQRI